MAEPEALQIARINQELTDLVETSTRDIALELTDELQEATRIDTGFAKANWIPTTGAPVNDAIGQPGDPGPAAAAQSAGITRLRGYRLEQGKIYITNAADYIGTLVSSSRVVIALHSAVARVRFR